ncbi:MAG TPA: 3-phosphoserine/phosphohydroxythreonine transaminase [Rhodocyclaceae bacterium]
MTRPWNFSAGPAVLPEAVLRQVQEELLDWHGCGASVMEMSHRGREFGEILSTAEHELRALAGIPPSYRILFLQGGATLQFSQVPLNLLRPDGNGRSADYIVTGAWSRKAYREAARLRKVRCAASTEADGEPSDGFVRLPEPGQAVRNDQAAYLHVCTNETIHGVEIHDDGYFGGAVPVVADMSSHILSRPFDVTRYGLIYAGAQKNIGPAGVTVVIIRDDLIGELRDDLPTALDYRIAADNGSMFNTPPTFAIYVAGLVFGWLRDQGGLATIAARNAEKAELLYGAIDQSALYRNPVESACRSRMNVPFTLQQEGLDDAFLSGARERGLLGLKGHKSVGGMRASLYNAMPIEGVRALVDFLADFERRHA